MALFSQRTSIDAQQQQSNPQIDVEIVAAKAIDAARVGLAKAQNDPGLAYTYYLLTQLVLSARREDWHRELIPFGIHISSDAGLFDLTAEVNASIDAYLLRDHTQSDVSEMAQRSAGSTLTTLVGPYSITLFGNGREELQAAVQRYSSSGGFGELSQYFFANFIARYLNFHLSRITASQLGTDALRDIGDITRVNDTLYAHCYESARIVRDFSKDWFSKTEYIEGITLENSSRFMAHAIEKLRAELLMQGAQS